MTPRGTPPADTETAFATLSETQRAFLDELRGQHVRFVVVGGYAVRFYGCLRATADLDLVVDCDDQNLIGIQNTLMTLGAREVEHVARHLISAPRQRVKWRDVDLFSSVEDWSYDRLLVNALGVRIGDSTVLVISKRDLIETKRLATRNPERGHKTGRDVSDLRCLGDANDPVQQRA